MEPLYFRENENSGADAILFVHGGGISGRMWEESLQKISEFHCLAPDLPGHGRSAHLSPFTLAGATEGLADLIHARVPSGRVSLVAFSVGVSIAIELLEQHPELIEKAFLSGPTPRFSRIAAGLMNTFSRPFLSVIGAEQRVRLVASSLGLPFEQVESFREDLGQVTPDLVRQINNVVAAQRDPSPGSPPIIVFAGEKELGGVKKRARELVSAAGSREGYIVRGLGHGWCYEDPQLFHKTVRSWMSNGRVGEQFIPLA